MQNGVKRLYGKIQKLLIGLVPENWKSIYLYASVLNGKNGEMYFYYFPKKIIKTRPVNCYEVPNKFGIDEMEYNNGLKKLYSYIKGLNDFSFPRWTNVTIIIENDVFTIEYKYNDIIKSPYNDEQRRLVWSNKYLKIPIESLSITEKALIETYNEEAPIKPIVYSEPIIKNKKGASARDISQEEDNNSINQILKY